MRKKHLLGMLLAVVACVCAFADNNSVTAAQAFIDAQTKSPSIKLANISSTQAVEGETVEMQANPVFDKLGATFAELKGGTAAKKAAAKVSRAAKLSLPARAVQFDVNYSTGERSCSGGVSIVANGDGKAIVYNFFGQTDTLDATIDVENGKFSILPGKVYDHPTYGPVWVCYFSPSQRVYSTSLPIEGTIDEDGNIALGGWGLFVVEGSSKGGSFVVCNNTDLMYPNAIATHTVLYSDASTTDSTITVPLYIEQPYANRMTIYNYATNGTGIIAKTNADSTIVISPQYVFNNALLGDFFLYAANYSKNKNGIKQAPEVELTDEGFVMGNWGVFGRSSVTTGTARYIQTDVVFNGFKIQFPDGDLATDWTGDGTESSPYIITKGDQMVALAQSVNGGNSYKDKYFKLGNDIDMSQTSMAVEPIGSDTKPFSATFDGAGYTIKSFSLNEAEVNYQGLFGYADSSSVIKNINLDAVSISTYGKFVGSLAGYAAGKVQNVSVTNAEVVAGNINVGGVVGYYSGYKTSNSISKVKFSGSVSGMGNTGGVIGELYNAKAEYLESHGSVTLTGLAVSSSNQGVGGTVGYATVASRGASSIYDSYNDASVSSTATSQGYCGGLVGWASSTDITRCYNAGPISAKAATPTTTSTYYGVAGGLVGLLMSSSITDCFNANILVNNSTAELVGGLVGNISVPTLLNGVYTNLSHVTNSINYGQVVTPEIVATQVFAGKSYADSIFTNCYYDSQIAGVTVKSENIKGLSTAELTAGTAIAGLDASVWTYTAGMYPRLASNGSTEAAVLMATPLTLSAGDHVRQVKKSFTISTDNSVEWKLLSNSYLVDETSGLKIDGNNVTLKNATSDETIVARPASKSIFKMLQLNTVNPTSFVGSGTESDPYLIRNKADLQTLDEFVTSYGQQFIGSYFKQTADIDIASDETTFEGIGGGAVASLRFGGDYNGDGHYIHNLKINRYTLNETTGAIRNLETDKAYGLFNFVGEEGVIHDVNIASDCEIIALAAAAGVAGYNRGTIRNCRNYATVKTYDEYAGGIAGYQVATATVENCYNAGEIVSGGGVGGGVVGFSSGKILYSQNDGHVCVDSLSSYNATERRPYLGGIVGSNNGTAIVGNVNTGTVNGYNQVGGILGYFGIGEIEVRDNVNYGVVTGSAGDGAVGGISGNAKPTTATMSSNYFDKQINYMGASNSNTAVGTVGVETTVLTAAKIDSLDTEALDLAEGLYPVIKTFKDEPAAVAHRKMVVKFGTDETSNDVGNPATLYVADDLKWNVAVGKDFSIADNQLKLTPSVKGASLTDTLVAVVGNYNKEIAVRAFAPDFDGSGTEADPFQLKTRADMDRLANYTNEESFPFSHRYFKVMNDIDFGSAQFLQIAASTKFDGVLDGNNKQLLSLNTLDDCEDNHMALFGTLSENSYVHDLILGSGKISGRMYTSALAAYVYGTVERVENRVTVNTNTSTGATGLVGYVRTGGKLIDCVNRGTIMITKGSSAAGIAYRVDAGALLQGCVNYADIVNNFATQAGIAISNGGEIIDCVNNGAVSGKGTQAGIATTVTNGAVFRNCVNNGAITGTSTKVAGILSATTSAITDVTIANCVNNGAINGSSYCGGIGGQFYTGVKISDCVNKGDVTGIAKATYIGGIVGQITGSADAKGFITHCANVGNIHSEANYSGGLAASAGSNVIVTDSYSFGDVESTANYSGGLIGGLNANVSRCFAVGNVSNSSTSYGAGEGAFAGYGNGVADRCFAIGDVKSSKTTKSSGVAGGFWGYGYPTISNTYHMGDVTAEISSSGFFGGAVSNSGPLNISNSYNVGAVNCDSLTGNFMQSTTYAYEFSNNYYNTDFSKVAVSGPDAKVNAVNTRGLVKANLGAAFKNQTGKYPVIDSEETLDIFNTVADFYAATVVPAEGETLDHIKSQFQIGTGDSITWTASSNLKIEGNNVATLAVGEATLTKKIRYNVLNGFDVEPVYREVEKTYTLNVDAVSGVDGIDADSEIVKAVYYNVAGVELGQERPTAAGVYVVTETYSNGKVASRKIVVK